MAYIFMDESGDLGFDFAKARTSRYFVVTFLMATDKRPIEKIVKKIFHSFSPRERKAHRGVLHCHKEKKSIRKRVLTEVAMKKVSILSIYLNKSKVYTKLQDEKQVLYNYVTNILLDRLLNRSLLPLTEPIELVASKRETNSYFNENFRSYLTSQTQNQHRVNIRVQIRTPAEEKCLQIVDFISWAIFRRREYGDWQYWDLIKTKVIEDNALFP